MLRCLSRFADARMVVGVEDVLLRLGVVMFDVCTVRYASAGDEKERNGCWGGGAKVNAALMDNKRLQS
jgi:hypothetical protein